MSIFNFKDTEETNENVEQCDNTEKRRNQILEMPEDYDDNFDKKMDQYDHTESEKKPDKGSQGDSNGFLQHIKSIFSKNQIDETIMEKPDSNGERIDSKTFRESLKVTMSPDEVKQYNKEHGYPDVIMDRPKGGWERTPYKDDPRLEDDDESMNKEQNDNLD